MSDRRVHAWQPFDAGDEVRIVLDWQTAALLAERLEEDMRSDSEEEWDVRSRPRMNLHYLGYELRDLLNMHYDVWQADNG